MLNFKEIVQTICSYSEYKKIMITTWKQAMNGSNLSNNAIFSTTT